MKLIEQQQKEQKVKRLKNIITHIYWIYIYKKHLLFNITGDSSQYKSKKNKNKKGNKGIKRENNEVKLFLFTNNMIFCKEKLNESKKKSSKTPKKWQGSQDPRPIYVNQFYFCMVAIDRFNLKYNLL